MMVGCSLWFDSYLTALLNERACVVKFLSV
jgi:hypothetical protein